MNRSQTWLVNLILLACDMLALLLIFWLALMLRFALVGPGTTWTLILPLVQIGIMYCVGALYIAGLYPGYGLTAVKELEFASKAISLAFFALAATAFLNKPFQAFSRFIVFFGWGLALVLLPLLRFVVRGFLSGRRWYGQPVHVYGDESLARKIVSTFARIPRLGWRVARYLPVDRQLSREAADVDVAILALHSTAAASQYVRNLSQNYRKVVLVRDERGMGALYVRPRDLEGRLGLEYHYHLLSPRALWLKWGLDASGALLLSFVLAPLALILALWIRLDSPGPVFYRQERLGKKNSRFQIIKFRTMVVDADRQLQALLQNDPRARDEYAHYHKLRRDPRITRAGRWLRRFSLDELPQLWNVLRGEMSLVGPRAYLPSELSDMGAYAETILRVRSGMTGWWQVLGRHNTTFQRRLEMDEYYISNWSLWMDFYILLKTIGVILRGKGA